MPQPKDGEDKKEYIPRCIAYLKKEKHGISADQAAAECYALWKKYTEGKKE